MVQIILFTYLIDHGVPVEEVAAYIGRHDPANYELITVESIYYDKDYESIIISTTEKDTLATPATPAEYKSFLDTISGNTPGVLTFSIPFIYDAFECAANADYYSEVFKLV